MLTFNFDPFPILETSRLKLRALVSTDASVVYDLRSCPETMKYIPRPLAKNLQDAENHIKTIQGVINKKEGINWAITLKDTEDLIGLAGFYMFQPENFRSEIGYMLLPKHQNKGYLTELVPTLLKYAFEVMHFHSIEAVIAPENIASERVLQKNGFIKEAHLRENIFWDGQFLDTVIYSILSKDFGKKSV